MSRADRQTAARSKRLRIHGWTHCVWIYAYFPYQLSVLVPFHLQRALEFDEDEFFCPKLHQLWRERST